MIEREIHWKGNMKHRSNGPAVIWEDADWDWALFGRWHRYYGPQDRAQAWWIHGELIINAKAN